MSRIIKVGAAQSGPVQKAEDRDSTVARLLELMKQARSENCDMVVFTELALTTFFPRYYSEDRAEMDVWFETAMPNPATQPLFDYARDNTIGFSLGYGELTPDGRHFNTQVLVDKTGEIIGKYRKVHLPGHAELEPERSFQHLEKRYFLPGQGFSGVVHHGWRRRHVRLQRPPLAGNIPGHGVAGCGNGSVGLQHAEQ